MDLWCLEVLEYDGCVIVPVWATRCEVHNKCCTCEARAALAKALRQYIEQ